MQRTKKRLTAAAVRTAQPGRHFDNYGLHLLVRDSGSRSWVWRGRVKGTGRRIDLGIGSTFDLTLAEARDTAFQYKREARRGVDPRSLRRGAGVATLREAVEKVIALNRPTWKNGSRSEVEWWQSFTYAERLLGRPVDSISTADVLGVMAGVWVSRPTTAKRLLQRLSLTFRWCIGQGFIESDPTIGAKAVLPRQNGCKTAHAAVHHSKVGDALRKVRESASSESTRLAIEFTVLTGARSGEARAARWSEIDLDAKTWTVPAERMKAGRAHTVPLSTAAVDVKRAAGRFVSLYASEHGGCRRTQARRGKRQRHEYHSKAPGRRIVDPRFQIGSPFLVRRYGHSARSR